MSAIEELNKIIEKSNKQIKIIEKLQEKYGELDVELFAIKNFDLPQSDLEFTSTEFPTHKINLEWYYNGREDRNGNVEECPDLSLSLFSKDKIIYNDIERKVNIYWAMPNKCRNWCLFWTPEDEILFQRETFEYLDKLFKFYKISDKVENKIIKTLLKHPKMKISSEYRNQFIDKIIERVNNLKLLK